MDPDEENENELEAFSGGGNDASSDVVKATRKKRFPMTTETEEDSWPEVFRCEGAMMLRIGIPMIFSSIGWMFVSFVCLVFAGNYLSADEIAAFSMSALFVDVGVLCIASGFGGTIIDGLCTQEFGADPNSPYIAEQFQNTVVMLVPLQFMWMVAGFFAQRLLLLLGQSEEVAIYGAQAISINMWCLPLYTVFESLKRYLQAQHRAWPGTICMAVAATLNPAILWGLIPYGIRGLAASYAITLSLPCFLMHGYLAWRGELPYSKPKHMTRPALRTALHLGLSGIALASGELFFFTSCQVASGWIGGASQAAYSFIIQIAALAYMVAFGIGGTAAVRVGNKMGESGERAAKRTALAIWGIAMGWAAVACVFILALHNYLPRVFTNLETITTIVAKSLVLIGPFQFADVGSATAQGILRGAGRPLLGMLANSVVFYPVALPLAGYLCFHLHWGVYGLWVGLVVGQFSAVCLMVIAILRMEWHRVK